MEKPLTSLADVFRYTAQDIRLNRNGQLSASQRRHLWLKFWGLVLGGLLLILTPVLLSWGLILWGSNETLVFTDSRALIGYLVGLVLGVIYLVANGQELLLLLDLLRGRVVMVDAPAQVWGKYLMLDQYRFVLDDAMLALIKSGLRYRAFLLPASQTLLSIEFSE